MLVLTRKMGQSLLIGDDIKVTVIANERGQISIGIDAPKHINIVREEIAGRLDDEGNKIEGREGWVHD